MYLVLIFLLVASVSSGQATSRLVMKYNDSATYVTNKNKDYDKGLYYIDKAIELDSNYEPSYEKKTRFLMVLKKYDEAIETLNKQLSLFENNQGYLFMLGLLLENKGDTLAAFMKYREADAKYKAKLDSTAVTNWNYEFILVNRAMNLLFLREDSLAKKICVDYYENYKKNISPDWLARILRLDREYYYCIFLGKEKQ